MPPWKPVLYTRYLASPRSKRWGSVSATIRLSPPCILLTSILPRSVVQNVPKRCAKLNPPPHTHQFGNLQCFLAWVWRLLVSNLWVWAQRAPQRRFCGAPALTPRPHKEGQGGDGGGERGGERRASIAVGSVWSRNGWCLHLSPTDSESRSRSSWTFVRFYWCFCSEWMELNGTFC